MDVAPVALLASHDPECHEITGNRAGDAMFESKEGTKPVVDHILGISESTGWKLRGATGAAKILGLKPTKLESRMIKLGVSRHKSA